MSQRAQALDVAREVGSHGIERHDRLVHCREAFEKADRYRLESHDLSHRRKALAGDRHELLEKLRQQAAGLDLSQLTGRLPAEHLKALRDLQQADELHLQPLRTALKAFRGAQQSRKPQTTLLHLAHNLQAICHTTPRKLLRRLTPPQLRLFLSVTTFAAALVKKLSSESPEQDESRRRVLGL